MEMASDWLLSFSLSACKIQLSDASLLSFCISLRSPLSAAWSLHKNCSFYYTCTRALMAWKENFASSHKAEADSQFVCRIARNLSSTHGESIREKEHHAEQRGRTVICFQPHRASTNLSTGRTLWLWLFTSRPLCWHISASIDERDERNLQSDRTHYNWNWCESRESKFTIIYLLTSKLMNYLLKSDSRLFTDGSGYIYLFEIHDSAPIFY